MNISVSHFDLVRCVACDSAGFVPSGTNICPVCGAGDGLSFLSADDPHGHAVDGDWSTLNDGPYWDIAAENAVGPTYGDRFATLRSGRESGGELVAIFEGRNGVISIVRRPGAIYRLIRYFGGVDTGMPEVAVSHGGDIRSAEQAFRVLARFIGFIHTDTSPDPAAYRRGVEAGLHVRSKKLAISRDAEFSDEECEARVKIDESSSRTASSYWQGVMEGLTGNPWV